MVIDNESPLTQKQERAIIALLNEPSIPRAATAAEIAERTIYRWMKSPTFMSEYRARRREAFGQAIALTQRYATLAVTTLVRVMSDDAAPHHARVSAATALLKLGRDGIELDDLAARVELLESAAEVR